ncbi:hypothetical protein BJF84_10410 [Rhodococcus sp. CUA-806]|nr:hypothetical protein BJF84_10410 [Rhodococcus sp. CUA-806]
MRASSSAGTNEDPSMGAHEAFLDELTGVAEAFLDELTGVAEEVVDVELADAGARRSSSSVRSGTDSASIPLRS